MLLNKSSGAGVGAGVSRGGAVVPSSTTRCHRLGRTPQANLCDARGAPPRALTVARAQPKDNATATTTATTTSGGVRAEFTKSMEEELEGLRAENEMLKREMTRLRRMLPGVLEDNDKPALDVDVVAPAPDADVSSRGKAGAAPAGLESGILWPTKGEARFWERDPRTSRSPLKGPSSQLPPVEKDSRSLHIVHLTAEMAPLAKVGGLGDVVTGLARSCLERGHTVHVILPFYESLTKDCIEGLKHEMDFDTPKAYRWDGEMRLGALRTSVYSGKIVGCPVFLVRPADWNSCTLFRGGRIYGGSYNEIEAYLYFCRASLEFLKVSGQQPHIVQLHDWHAAAAALLYWEVYNSAGLWRPRLVLTIHNLDNTGEVRQDEFFATGVPGETFATADKALDERTIGHNPERINLMKGGLVYSNAVTTVSPTYGKEVLSGGAAGWLRSTFDRPEIKSKFKGILNGIDAVEWDPATDALLPANYSPDQPQGKALCKRFLQMGLGLDVDPSKPLVAVVSRLVPQKGIHLIKAAVYRTVQQGGQFVLLGSGHSDGAFKAMAANEFKDHPNCRLQIMFSERLAHLIYAAADFVLVPSMFEPCGLTQLIALRYGAVPIVRRTGGLADTVFDVDSSGASGNGYVFDGADEGSLNGALDRALKLYTEQPERFSQLSESNLRQDVSWRQSAKSYVDLYSAIALQN